MADLESLGFITSPHTSAGPRAHRQGLPFLRRLAAAGQAAGRRFESRGDPAPAGLPADSSKALVATASQLLSNITQLAGVVTLPLAHAASMTQIEFLPLSENRVLVVLVLNNSEVQNRIIQLERHYSAEELRRAANFSQ